MSRTNKDRGKKSRPKPDTKPGAEDREIKHKQNKKKPSKEQHDW